MEEVRPHRTGQERAAIDPDDVVDRHSPLAAAVSVSTDLVHQQPVRPEQTHQKLGLIGFPGEHPIDEEGKLLDGRHRGSVCLSQGGDDGLGVISPTSAIAA